MIAYVNVFSTGVMGRIVREADRRVAVAQKGGGTGAQEADFAGEKAGPDTFVRSLTRGAGGTVEVTPSGGRALSTGRSKRARGLEASAGLGASSSSFSSTVAQRVGIGGMGARVDKEGEVTMGKKLDIGLSRHARSLTTSRAVIHSSRNSAVKSRALVSLDPLRIRACFMRQSLEAAYYFTVPPKHILDAFVRTNLLLDFIF